MSELIESAEEKMEFVIINDEMISVALSTSVCLLSDLIGNVAEQIGGVVDSKGEENGVVDRAAEEDGFVKVGVEEICLVDVGTIDDGI